ncbi:MAG: peptidylprolyl isomerase [Polyangiales bacterium]
MSKKREVRDARFRDRESVDPPQPKPARPKPEPAARASSPSRARPSTPRAEEPSEPPPAAPAPSSLPSWLSPNWVVPAVMALFLGGALYEKFGPFPRAGADAGAAASADGGAAGDAAVATADAAPAAPDVSAPPTPPPPPPRPAPNDGAPVEARTMMPTSPDPLHGTFTLAQATAGLTGTGDLHADIETTLGTFDCTLLEREAPVNVANFVGLARGLRDFWDPVAGAWTKRPFYDGSIFHRVIPEFMIQGGDQLRSGVGDTGYILPDENVRPHNAPGLLCMANKGPGTASAQFFITEVPKPDLDDSFSIFGRCTPTDLVNRIARVPRGAADRPNAPVYIYTVRIRRG